MPGRGLPWHAPERPDVLRSPAVIVTVAVLAAACASGDRSTTSSSTTGVGEPPNGREVAAAPASAGAREPIRSSSVDCDPDDFHWAQPDCRPAHSVEFDQIVLGGPRPDGIPPIDEPVYETIADAATWLEPASPVLVVDIDDDVRAYPLGILTWHEIVNDVVGGRPVVVTYCPLCNSALVFDRRVDGPTGRELLDFGTSGRLFNSNLVMYDRQYHNLWTQFEGEGIVGEEFLGTRLTRIPGWLLGFDELAELHPEARVLSRDTGQARPYGRNPYRGYDAANGDPFLFRGDPDPRMPAMTRLVGIGEQTPTAILLDQLQEDRVVHLDVDGNEVVVVWSPGQASALDTATIADGRDVGQTAAFLASVDGVLVELEPTDTGGRFVDALTGSTFDLRGRALDGPLGGGQLTPIPHDDTFWFVWVAFRPDTTVAGQ